jgi:hypothetical protein
MPAAKTIGVWQIASKSTRTTSCGSLKKDEGDELFRNVDTCTPI